MINVTKVHLPNQNKYKKYVDEIYSNNWVTNYGKFVKELEQRLEEFLGVKNLILVSNGTSALEIAYRALDLKGSVITTPFSFVATTSSLVTNNLKPIFCDINEKTFNLDEKNIENHIKKDTSAIVPVHVFGNPCKVNKIDKIAKKHNLKVIYDAAHAFDVKYKDKSILNYGDISVLSFHATKLFHTIEGGAVIVNDDKLARKIRYLINFGIKGIDDIPELGINAKMNEFEAIMGLCVLDEFLEIKKSRKEIYDLYKNELNGFYDFQKINKNISYNHSYFPILFKNENTLKKYQQKLNESNIYPRRYFYPSLDTLKYIKSKKKMKISRNISSRILCLPTYTDLSEESQLKIIEILKSTI